MIRCKVHEETKSASHVLMCHLFFFLSPFAVVSLRFSSSFHPPFFFVFTLPLNYTNSGLGRKMCENDKGVWIVGR